VSNYRLSISWSRILPDGHTINAEGVTHYVEVITELLAQDIEPFVTLYHWDLPQAVYEETNGGWINESIVDYFVTYADTVFDLFHKFVPNWLTFNEPWTFCVEGYDGGQHAPGRCSDRDYCDEGDSSTEVYQCAHSVLLAHAATVKLFRDRGYSEYGDIGITLNCDWAEPASESPQDVAAAQRNLEWQLGWFADPIWFGDYPKEMKERVGYRLPIFTKEQQTQLKGSWDFFGLNHYTTKWVADNDGEPECTGTDCDWFTDQYTNTSPKNQHNGTMIGVKAESDWLYVVPWGIRKMLHWVKSRYGNPPIYVTENGVDVPNENDKPLDEALADMFRVDFYKYYIGNMSLAVQEGVDVRGYFAWSLMDNFEWADGYSKRFGLHYVDYDNNLTRYQKDSAKFILNYTVQNPHADYETHLKLFG